MEDRRCECGAGYWAADEKLHIQAHALDCPTLRAIVEREQAGWCTRCGSQKVSERNGEIVYCPNGCSRQISGTAALEVFDDAGSGWIRDALENKIT